MIDHERPVALYSVYWVVLKILFTGHLPFRLWHEEPAAYSMTHVIIKGDLFGNRQYVETFLQPFFFFFQLGHIFPSISSELPGCKVTIMGNMCTVLANCVPDAFPVLSIYINDLSP